MVFYAGDRVISPAAPGGGGGDGFTANFDDAQAVNYGFNNRRSDLPYGNFWTQSAIAGGGPGGIDSVRVTAVNGGTITDNQTYMGWEHNSSGLLEIPAFGELVSIGMWFKLNSPFFGSAQPDPYVPPFGGSRWGNKLMIYGQGGPPNQRMIWNFGALGDPSTWWLNLEQGIEGGATRIEVTTLSLDTWYKLQWVCWASSARDVSDAHSALYIDGDNSSIATPTYESGTYIWNSPDCGDNVSLGGYADAADDDTEVVFEIAKFQVRSAFDATFGS